MSPFDYSVAAEELGLRLKDDPEVGLPRRPRLPPEMLVLPHGRRGLLFVGGRLTQLLTGESARTLVPEVLTHLDGTRTCAEITAALPGVTLADVEAIVGLLFGSGLLEDGDAATRGNPELEGYLGRFVDVTRNNRNRGEALDRLRDASVAVVGRPDVAAAVAAQLTGSGVGTVRAAAPAAGQQPDMVVAIATRQDEDLAPVLERARAAGISALHVRLAAAEMQMGPLFVPGVNACYGCMRTLYALPDGDAEPLFREFWIARAALLALHLLGRLADMRVLNGYDAYQQTPEGIEETHRYVARLPGCPRCGVNAAPLARRSPELLAWLFHASVALPPRALASRRAHQRHYLAQNLAETRRGSDAFYARETTMLPTAAALTMRPPWEVAPAPGRAVTVADLAAVLQMAAGEQDAGGRRRRIAPTGGGMGSPHMFIVAHRVAGLAPGVYQYCGVRHALVRLGDSSAAELAQVSADLVDAPCLLVGAAALQKLRFKYYNFAYRIAYLDAGFALGCALDVATALGLDAWQHTGGRDETIAELVRMPRKDDQYAGSFMLALGVPPPASLAAAAGGGLPPAHEPEDFALAGPRLFEFMVAAAAEPGAVQALAFANRPPGATFGTEKALGTLLLERRSVRSYRAVAPEQRAVEYIMAASATRLSRLWLARVGSAELPAGIYASPPAAGGAVRHAGALTPNALRECLNQSALAEAPALLLFETDLEYALAERGVPGYRDELMEAGRAGWRAVLAAEAVGLGACPTAGLIEAGVRLVLGGDGYRRCALLAVALGYPEGRM